MAVNYNKQNKKLDSLRDKVTTLGNDNARLRGELDSWMNLKHETAKLNSSILSLAEELSTLSRQLSESHKKDSKELKKISDLSTTIAHTASIIDSRIVYAELELNKGLIDKQTRFTSTIYKKFDKARYVLYKEASEKKIKIEFKNNSTYSIQAIKAFDCVPFIILDNAIKYSPKNNYIEVQFNETIDELEVVTSSIGPKVEKENLSKLLERGFREPNATMIGVSGQGLGLYVAEQLCSHHDIQLIPNSDPKRGNYTSNGVDYCEFSITLKMKKVLSQ
ncbi:sensor histidine kinase [Actinobacillus equuli]|uniref:sensor histidine kinase n=1 Tax=Actinobacillus equuli TaxID=718 RepID=UPI002441F85C|nr:ATP-binding protein [Actinobacillus equuli]WGE85328.1 ATP-binding protein [Actinobacillus equuli subsp. haemolyticus]